jgi:hypothetical protein
VALLAAACVAAPQSLGFVETVQSMAREGRVSAEAADEVVNAYLDMRAGPSWWEPLLRDTWNFALLLLGSAASVIWVRYAPPKLGGRGAPEVARQKQRARGT